MAVTLGDPIIITSGTLGTRINGPRDNIKIARLYWDRPSLGSTSSLIIRKGSATGAVLATLTCETSGQSQTLELKQWANNLFCDSVPTGTLYIYTK